MLLAEQALVRLRLRGQHVQAAVTVFADEARRRSEARLGAVDSRALLTALYDLPWTSPYRSGRWTHTPCECSTRRLRASWT